MKKNISKRIFLSPPHMGGEELELVREAFESNYIAPLGPMVDAFEREFAAYTGIPHCLALTSGTAAMHLALRELGVGPGDEVLASTLTFIGSISSATFLGASLRFIDAEERSWNMDPNLLAEELKECDRRGKLPKAVIPTDLYGQCCDLPRLLDICARYQIPVVCDSAEAMGARCRATAEPSSALRPQPSAPAPQPSTLNPQPPQVSGPLVPISRGHIVTSSSTADRRPPTSAPAPQPSTLNPQPPQVSGPVVPLSRCPVVPLSCGPVVPSSPPSSLYPLPSSIRHLPSGTTWHHAGCGAKAAVYSFNGNKIMTASGAGMLASHDPKLIEHARKLSQQARDPAPHYEHTEIGYNYRMSNILAAIGRGQLRVLDQRVQAKRRIFDQYQQMLGDLPGITFMPEAPTGRCNRWLTVILVDPAVCGVNSSQIRLALEAENIEARPLWKPMHLQPVFRKCHVRGGAVSERLFHLGLCLPSGTAMTSSDIERVVDTVRKYYVGQVHHIRHREAEVLPSAATPPAALVAV